MTPGVGITSEVYREQAQRIDELERENKRLISEVEESQIRWRKGEEELEDLREGRGDVALAIEKAKEADKLVRVNSESYKCANSSTEIRRRVAQTTAIAAPISKYKVYAPHVDSITFTVHLDRRPQCASRVEIGHDRIAGARDLKSQQTNVGTVQ